MEKLRIAVIGNGTEVTSLCDLFKNHPAIEVAGLADISGNLTETSGINHSGVSTFQTVEELVSIDGLEIIFVTTDNHEISNKLRDLNKPNIQVVESSYLHLLKLIKNQNYIFETSLLSLIQSVEDGVQIVDRDGYIIHINNSFLNLCGLTYKELMGQNIFEIMPESPTAKSLKQGKPLSGDKYRFHSYSKEVSFNVTPLVNGNIICGSVAVYRELNDVRMLMKELSKARALIEDIYERLSQSENFPGLIDSDVIPIDHMEQNMLKQALTKFGFTVEGKKMAAKALNISLATLYNKLKKYQIS